MTDTATETPPRRFEGTLALAAAERAVAAAWAVSTCELCGIPLAGVDPADACPEGASEPHRPTFRTLAATEYVTVEMLDELGPEHPVGIGEIAQALGVKRQTVDVWKWKSWFPEPSPTTLGTRPFWFWGDVRAWAVEAGKLIEQPPTADAPEEKRVKIGRAKHPRSTPAHATAGAAGE